MNAFSKFCAYAYLSAVNALEGARQKVRKTVEEVAKDESGMEIIAVILILAVVIALVVIFRKNIANIVNAIFGQITQDTNAALNGDGGSATPSAVPSAVQFK